MCQNMAQGGRETFETKMFQNETKMFQNETFYGFRNGRH